MDHTKRLFISADMEGCCGVARWGETEPDGKLYEAFAAQMTREAAAAVLGAEDAGYLSTVKDAHDAAANLRPLDLPPSARLVRGWERDVWCMMDGLNREPYDAVAFTGYHSPAASRGNPLSHTMDPSLQSVRLNGRLASEFLLNAYLAAYLGVPSVFLSGDEDMCGYARELIPGITTVATKTGFGSAVISPHPQVVCDRIREGVHQALSSGDLASCLPRLPRSFTIEVTYADWNAAHRNALYPGAEAADSRTVSFTATDYYEILRFMSFCL